MKRQNSFSDYLDKLKDHKRKVPLLRGRVYFGNFILILYFVNLISKKTLTPVNKLSFTLSFLTTTASTVVTGFYHNQDLDNESRNIYKRIDYAMNFLAIPMCYFPIYIHFIQDDLSLLYVLLDWTLALTGVFSSLVFDFCGVSKWARVAGFISIGNLNHYISYKLYKAKMWDMFFDVFIGSCIYFVSGFIYGSKFPNPVPRVFEHHELMHSLIILGNFFTFRSNYRLL